MVITVVLGVGNYRNYATWVCAKISSRAGGFAARCRNPDDDDGDDGDDGDGDGYRIGDAVTISTTNAGTNTAVVGYVTSLEYEN